MRSSNFKLGFVYFALSSCVLSAGVKIDLPKDSPVSVITSDFGDSSETARGGAMLLDLHAALTLRNSTQRRIRGITMLVMAQEATPGGKGSVTVTSLDVGPNESFPVRIDLRLLRPLQAAGGATVQIGLDGVLFDDLSFYGPDKLSSKRSLTLCEWEARRDRRHFKTLLAEGGDRLQREMLSIQAHQTDRRSVDVQMVRGGRATNFEPETEVKFAFLRLPDSPIEPTEGMARIAGNEARAPRMEVKNLSDRPVRYLEIGWILHDRGGREFLAGSVPAALNLAPGQKSQVLENTTLKFPTQRGGQPLAIEGMTGFVSSVEFADGSMWIPSRADLDLPQLQRVMAPSDEEQRLVQIYAKRGIKGLIAELNRF
jgi:hypothetical protein